MVIGGKFSQRGNKTATHLYGTNQGRDLFKTLCNPQLQLTNVSLFDDTVMTEFKYKDVYATEAPNTNIFIGTTVTSEARVYLYQQMSKLDNILYCEYSTGIFFHRFTLC